MARGVVIRFKETAPIEVEVDLGRLTWRDVFELQRLSPDAPDNERRVVEIVQKCIPDQDVMELPADTMEPVMRAIMTRVRGVEDEQKN